MRHHAKFHHCPRPDYRRRRAARRSHSSLPSPRRKPGTTSICWPSSTPNSESSRSRPTPRDRARPWLRSRRWRRFGSAHGAAWRFTVDLRRGVPDPARWWRHAHDSRCTPMTSGGRHFAPGCRENACIPLSTVEALARGFMEQNSSIFGVDPSQLEIDPEGSGPFGETMYFIRFQWKVGGVPGGARIGLFSVSTAAI